MQLQSVVQSSSEVAENKWIWEQSGPCSLQVQLIEVEHWRCLLAFWLAREAEAGGLKGFISTEGQKIGVSS